MIIDEVFHILFSLALKTKCVFDIYCTSQFGLAAFQVLSSDG